MLMVGPTNEGMNERMNEWEHHRVRTWCVSDSNCAVRSQVQIAIPVVYRCCATFSMATETLRLRFDDPALHSPPKPPHLSELQNGMSVSDLYR